MIYSFDWDKKAQKEFNKLDKSIQKQIQKFLNEFVKSDNPRQKGYGLKHELSGLWRYDINDYRVICEIKDDKLIVLAVKLGHRRDVYRKF